MPLINSITDSLIAGIVRSNAVTSCVLTDTSVHNKCVDIRVVASNPFWVLKIDDLVSNSIIDLYPFYQDIRNIKKCSDFIILYFKKDFFQVFICEMKSNSPSGHESQLDASYIFSKLLFDTAKRLVKDNSKVKYKGVLFSNRVWKNYSPLNAQGVMKTFLELQYFNRECGQEFNLDSHCFI